MACMIVPYACKKDNVKPLSSVLSGRVVYQAQPLGVRSNGVQLELWQHGYQLFSKIPVYVAQDGTFSAVVGDGDYKLVRLRGNGPWADNTDSIDVHVAGSATIDVPVDPFFVIKSAAFQKSGTNVTATFTIQKVNTTKALESVTLYLGQTVITDANNNIAAATTPASGIADPTQPIALTVTIPAAFSTKDYVFARAAVKISGVSERLYSEPAKVTLK